MVDFPTNLPPIAWVQNDTSESSSLEFDVCFILLKTAPAVLVSSLLSHRDAMEVSLTKGETRLNSILSSTWIDTFLSIHLYRTGNLSFDELNVSEKGPFVWENEYQLCEP